MTVVYFCSGVRLNNSYDHTIYFSSTAAQRAYFQSKRVFSYTAITYQRKTWKMRVESNYENARKWSYLYFANGTLATHKLYYYFINQCEYINDNTVELSLEIDVMQTYMFDWNILPCFVEREHSTTDAIGDNTVDEGLETGEFVCNGNYTSIINTGNPMIVMAATINLVDYFYNDVETQVYGGLYDGIFSGFGLYACPVSDYTEVAALLAKMQVYGKLDALFMMWQSYANIVSVTGSQKIKTVDEFSSPTGYYTWTRPTTIDGYTPKNNKLFQYPYSFMYLTNNQGGAASYRYEYFMNTDTGVFWRKGNVAPDGMVSVYPTNYKRNLHATDERLTLSNFPLCPWNADPYKLWLAQNQSQQNVGYAMNGIKIVAGIAAMAGGLAATAGTAGLAAPVGMGAIAGGTGMAMSGITGIAGQVAQSADVDVQPPQARGNSSSSHNMAIDIQNIDLYYKSIDAYHAEVIDNFFSMFGYATKKVKVPNISARPAWNYVKTIESNVTGNFPQEDIRTINAVFDRGITFWKNGNNIGDYSQNNDV